MGWSSDGGTSNTGTCGSCALFYIFYTTESALYLQRLIRECTDAADCIWSLAYLSADPHFTACHFVESH